MKVKDFSLTEVQKKCSSGALGLVIGPFNILVHSPLLDVSSNIYRLYQNFSVFDNQTLIDFSISLRCPSIFRQWIKPQVNFYCDDEAPFIPLPRKQAFPLFEWGLNWSIAQNGLQFLALHAAVLEKNGVIIILPAESGSGKSTLTAILMVHGWRVFSDELALIRHSDGIVIPLERPISLKNSSISLLKEIYPDSQFGSTVNDTNKGTISHLMPSFYDKSLEAPYQQANYIIFPKYIANNELTVSPINKAQAFMAVIENSFNYGLLGKQGFNTLTQLINQCQCYDLTYSAIDDVVNFFDSLE